MKLKDFVKQNDVMVSPNLVDEKMIDEIEKKLNLTIGRQVKAYILDYGFIIYGSAEMYGVNPRQGLTSDMVTQTEYLHKYFPKSRGKIAFHNRGEGDYFIVDSEDKVYEYDSELDELIDQNIHFEDFLIEYFKRGQTPYEILKTVRKP